ncbi:MAG: hypothetical protein R3C01_16090 [Planctomycetaceae bacterium]
MNANAELQKLLDLFPANPPAISQARAVVGDQIPEPYRKMLEHEHHMTVTMEHYHGCSVNVEVLDQHLDGDLYTRKILLRRSTDNVPVQYGIVRFHFEYVTTAVRDEILLGQTPLGRILINHNVLRHIELGTVLEIVAGPELAAALEMPVGSVTYGRLATIFCNGQPAVDLLEVSSLLTLETEKSSSSTGGDASHM